MTGQGHPLLAGLLTGGLIVAYDALAHYVSAFPDAAHWAALVTLAPAMALGLIFLHKRHGLVAAVLGGVILAALALHLWPEVKQNLTWLYLAQYLSTNLALGLYFGRSLGTGQTPACTVFASAVRDGLSPTLRSYTRKVTIAWTVFFLASALISTLLYFLAPAELWSLFSNVFYLPSLGLMFLVEGLIRHRILPAEDRHGFIETIRAYQASTRSTTTPPPGEHSRP